MIQYVFVKIRQTFPPSKFYAIRYSTVSNVVSSNNNVPEMHHDACFLSTGVEGQNY